MNIERKAICIADRRQGGRPYAELRLFDLVRLIVDDSDQEAVRELHENRTIFIYGEEEPMVLTNFLDLYRRSLQNLNWPNKKKAIDIINRSYDLTLEKFFNLPGREKHEGADCRNYFKAYLAYLSETKTDAPGEGQLIQETRAGAMLQRLVLKTFRRSMKEAKREQNPFWSRYRWQINGKSINLMMPKSLKGAERRVWLEGNIPDPDPDHFDEQARVQEIIDARLIGQRFVSLTEALEQQTAGRMEAELEYEYDLSISLAANVAQEKADNIEAQRPAIRRLGVQALQQMVLTIFDRLADESYRQKEISEAFGLSPGTISRFAGQNWLQKDGIGRIPDLWSNTAKVISGNPEFSEFARQAGVGEAVSRISDAAQPINRKEAQLG